MGSQFIPSHHILLKIGSFNTTFNVFYFIYLCVCSAPLLPPLLSLIFIKSTPFVCLMQTIVVVSIPHQPFIFC